MGRSIPSRIYNVKTKKSLERFEQTARFLLEVRLLNAHEAREVLALCRSEFEPAPDMTLRLGFARESEICLALAKAVNLRLGKTAGFVPPKEVLDMLPATWAVLHHVVPIGKVGDSLEVAAVEPLTSGLLAELTTLTRYRPVVRMVPLSEMAGLLARTYARPRQQGREPVV